MEGSGHGTSVTGVLGSAMNAAGMIGVTWSTNIIPVSVEILPLYFNKDVIVNAIDYARLSGAKIINLSLTHANDPSGAIQSAISRADNLLIVAAAGNTSIVKYPAKFSNSNILSVSGYARHNCPNDTPYCATPPVHPSDVDIAAPGWRICTICDNGYCELNGTSLAAPFATGAASLVLSRWPWLEPEDVIRIIKNNAKPQTWLTGLNSSHGTLDLRFLSLPVTNQPEWVGGYGCPYNCFYQSDDTP